VGALFARGNAQVDVDDQPEIAAAHGVSAMPTFIFIKNGQRIDELRGANAAKLEQLIQKHSGAGGAEEEESDLKLPAGHVRVSRLCCCVGRALLLLLLLLRC
jgi:thioredoxin-related protein